VRIGGDPITRATRPEEVPIPAALALMLREHLDRAGDARSRLTRLRAYLDQQLEGPAGRGHRSPTACSAA
jgi:hypothetical protein